MKFKEYIKQIEEMNTIGYHNDGPGGPFRASGGSYLSSDQTGTEQDPSASSDGHSLHLPSPELATLPSVTKRSRIASVDKNRNPIIVTLTDGTQMMFTWDEFRRIQQEPISGKTMTVVFQRLPQDKTPTPSQIQSIKVE